MNYPDRDEFFHLRPNDHRPHSVYELWNGDECIYVGMTCNLARRLSEHRKSSLRGRFNEVRSITVSSRLSAEGLETRLIFLLRPRWNLRWNPNHDHSLLSRTPFRILADAAHTHPKTAATSHPPAA